MSLVAYKINWSVHRPSIVKNQQNWIELWDRPGCLRDGNTGLVRQLSEPVGKTNVKVYATLHRNLETIPRGFSILTNLRSLKCHLLSEHIGLVLPQRPQKVQQQRFKTFKKISFRFFLVFFFVLCQACALEQIEKLLGTDIVML